MPNIKIQRDSRGVATLTLDRPAVLNAFDEATIAELSAAFARLDADPGVRVIVLTAEGRAFCAGADIAWMQRQSGNSLEDNLEDSRRFAEMLRRLHECTKPTVVRVNGSAFGGGVGLMAAADIVVSVDSARFAVSEAKFGILPAVIGPYLLRAIGPRQALRLAMTTSSFTAREAVTLGLVHACVEAGTLDTAVDEVVTQLLSSSPGSLREIKALYRQFPAAAIDPELRELTAATNARVRATDEAREGFAAFMAKRPPAWVRS